MMATLLAVLRSAVFYPVFYFGSLYHVLGATVVWPFSQSAFQDKVHGWSSWHRWCAATILGIRPRLENTDLRGGVIYAVRHEAFYEAIDLPTLFDRPVVFAKVELTQIPLWGRLAVGYGIVPVEREAGAKALRAMLKAARAYSDSGRPLVIFPEGTRVPHDENRELQAGFAGLYKLLGLPVVPVAVNSGPLYHRWIKRPGPMTYRFGEEIPPGLPRDEIEARVRTAINALHD